MIQPEEKTQTNHQVTPTIFHGIISKKVNLARVQPAKIIHAQEIFLQTDIDSKLNALKYRHPLKFLGELYKQIVVPCTPAYELSYGKKLSEEPSYNNKYLFAKVPGSTDMKGIPSGKRSAILYGQGEKLIRLKGCGNQQKGFNRQKNESRGHHFYHTAKRELYITSKLNKIFKKQLGIHPPANKPLYAYNFSNEAIQQLKIANELPLISKYCCVFETQGDRRAGTHLISPLQAIFLTIIHHKKAAWKPLFESKNRIDQGSLVEFVTNFDLIVDSGQKFIEVYDSSKEIQNYIGLEQKKLDIIENFRTSLSTLTQLLVVPAYVQHVKQLMKTINFQKFVQTCQILLWKIGYEMGQIKRVMCKNDISWGFYRDHGLEWHCNAHLNNFIVSNPKDSKQTTNFFLLPLDYDLSYSLKQFICIDEDSPYYGQCSEDVFQNYLCGQFSAMEMSLFGLQMMNFKYGINPTEYENEDTKMSRIVFRDSLVRAFNAGMREKQQTKQVIKKRWDENIADINKLVEFCLWLSIDFDT